MPVFTVIPKASLRLTRNGVFAGCEGQHLDLVADGSTALLDCPNFLPVPCRILRTQ